MSFPCISVEGLLGDFEAASKKSAERLCFRRVFVLGVARPPGQQATGGSTATRVAVLRQVKVAKEFDSTLPLARFNADGLAIF